MISYKQALTILDELAHARSVSQEELPLEGCVGRISARDFVSGEFIPSFNNSAMDGFAVCSERTRLAKEGTPLCLSVMDCLAAGDLRELSSQDPTLAVEIMTGAPMPEGVLDAVVRIEDVQVVKDAEGRTTGILMNRPVQKGENVRRKGEDFKPGQVVVQAGTRVMPEHVMALSSLGIAKLVVKKRPIVVVISTGRELVPYSNPVEKGQLRNSTAPYLITALPFCGVEPLYQGIVPDEPHLLEEALKNLLCDPPQVILTTGAVSVGKYDFVRSVLEKLGAQICFHKVAIRPGKPLLVAEWPQGPVLFGMPGNPISTAVGLRFFVEPYLRTLLGLPKEHSILAELGKGTSKPKGLTCFLKARLEYTSFSVKVIVLPGQASFMVRPLLSANAWAVLPEEGSFVEEGAGVNVYPLQGGEGEQTRKEYQYD